ncbi:hypothetical protein Glove_180g69 [Diversispora epigaea]|uniref:Uncharacterized protein n=1 Tax=Diversispora epigaea TaxID=1348612 RepID=A0A397IN22_9GLOM|nr:hypothetical protein Glove_180g69 [Diversispora epigaea]
MGVFTRTGGSISGYALIGGIFAGTESVVANIRKTDDWINGACAGCAAGLVAGIRAHSFPLALGACLGIGTAMSVYDWTGKNKGIFVGNRDKKNWSEVLLKKEKEE